MQGLSEQQRLAITVKVMESLQEWGIKPADQLKLLGMPDETRTRQLRRYHEDEAFPDDPRVNEHVYMLVGIADALRTTYPRNPDMGARWMRMSHRRFQNRRPVDVMVEGGLTGLIEVLSDLDCSYAWDRSGSSVGNAK